MADPTSEAMPVKPLRWFVRAALALLSVTSLVTAIIISPYVVLVVGMSFDSPGAEWGWVHLPMVTFPALLLSLAASAGWAALSSKVRPLWAVTALLVIDLTALAGMWLRA
jgi:2-keto-3-deoxy-galactonokinase